MSVFHIIYSKMSDKMQKLSKALVGCWNDETSSEKHENK